MARLVKPLTATQVQNAKPKDKPYKLFDGGGLFLHVTPKGGKHWKMKYLQANGKESLLSFGAYPEVTLEQARRKREEARSQKAAGKDPGEIRRQEKAEKEIINRNSFNALAQNWMALVASKVSTSTLYSYRGIITRNLIPALGNKYIKDIKPADILRAVRGLEDEGKIASSKIACRLSGQIMQYAIALGIIEIDPTPSLKILLKPYKVEHRAAIIDPLRLGKLLLDIDAYHSRCGHDPVGYALKIMPYVFVRTRELISAKWEQINFELCDWRYTVSKTNTQHVVPLAPQVVSLFKELRAKSYHNEFVFPNKSDNSKTLNLTTLISAVRKMGYKSEEMSVHGFRAIARTLLDEVLRERYEYIEHQLAHKVRDPNGRAYNRTEHIEERKRMMNRWANYLDELKEKARQLEPENLPIITLEDMDT